MGRYLNPKSGGFQESLRSAIYVDKSGLIAITNSLMRTRQKYMCISRPRRFGKSMAMDMLAAYYGCGEDTHALFNGLEIGRDAGYETNINKYNVIKLNMQAFLSSTGSIEELLAKLKRYLLYDLTEAYSNIRFLDADDLVQVMSDIFVKTDRAFVILIDEWDCLFREYREDTASQYKYLDFLRMWLKDQDYVALAYMTGILPIKKYGTHSALNMFTEYSMTNPRNLAPYFGFTEAEVRALCSEYKMNYDEAKAWYDGYALTESTIDGDIIHSMYNPKSIVESMLSHCFDTYWNQTETYEALKVYIQMNIDGLKDCIIKMLAGGSVCINTGTFINDMTTFATKDDIMTLLVHLGYLSYHWGSKSVVIPNKEVSQEYVNAISTMDWHEVARSVEASRRLLESLWNLDGTAVAEGIDRAHNEISILKYNDENSLCCTINLAFYFAKEYYTIIRELPGGKGFADICLVPRPLHMDKPAVIIELKRDKDAEGAIDQIKNKQYVKALEAYKGNLLLAGINYDSETKQHSCKVEQYEL